MTHPDDDDDGRLLRFLAAPGGEAWAGRLAAALGATTCALESRRFPDGEVYLRLQDDPAGASVAVVAELRDPDPQLPGLFFLADALRELGASRVGLVAPYLPYMRQDARLKSGEAVTSRSFARLVSAAFDWLATVDPHLHRHASLDEIYSIPTAVAAAAPAIAAWVRDHVERPCLVGPDEESVQWVEQVARLAGCPYLVWRKERRGDRDVAFTLPHDGDLLAGRTPVLVDDIVSSARTLAGAAQRLVEAGQEAPVCIGVHGLFAGDAEAVLAAAGVARVVSCNTVAHPSNAIDVTPALAEAVRSLARGTP